MTTITVFVPTLGRKSLDAMMVSVMNQTRKPDVIDILVDNTSLGDKMIKGVNRCETDYIAPLDDDIIIPPNFLEVLEKKLNESEKNDYAGGSCLPLLKKSSSAFEFAVAKTQQSYLTSYKLADRFKVSDATDKGEDMVVGSGLYRTSILRYILNYPDLSKSTHDLFVFSNMKKLGGNVCYVPEASYLHQPRDSFRRYFWQIFRSGVGRVNIFKSMPNEVLKKPYYLFPISLLCGLVTMPLTGWWFIGMSYLVAISFAWSVNIRDLAERPKSIFWFPILVVTTHTSYGLGFLYGLFKREVKWN